MIQWIEIVLYQILIPDSRDPGARISTFHGNSDRRQTVAGYYQRNRIHNYHKQQHRIRPAVRLRISSKSVV